MKHVLAALGLLAFVTACGADGEPTPPQTQSGVTISGTARIGVAGRL